MIKKIRTYVGLLVAIALSVAGAAHTVVGAPAERCIDDWSEAAAIVKSRQMMDVSEVSDIARKKFDGRIMTARLCTSDRGYFYRLVIRRGDGRARQLNIEAERPEKRP